MSPRYRERDGRAPRRCIRRKLTERGRSALVTDRSRAGQRSRPCLCSCPPRLAPTCLQTQRPATSIALSSQTPSCPPAHWTPHPLFSSTWSIWRHRAHGYSFLLACIPHPFCHPSTQRGAEIQAPATLKPAPLSHRSAPSPRRPPSSSQRGAAGGCGHQTHHSLSLSPTTDCFPPCAPPLCSVVRLADAEIQTHHVKNAGEQCTWDETVRWQGGGGVCGG